MKSRISHIRMQRPKFVLVEFAAAEALIHLQHLGPMNQDQLYESINVPTEPKLMSRSTLVSAMQLLRDIHMVKRAPGTADRKQTVYALVKEPANVDESVEV
jgi:hypothetical protein